MTAAKHSYLRTHTMSGKLLTFNANTDADELLTRARAAKAGRAARTFVKEGPLRVTMVALRRGVALQEHAVAGAVTVHVLRGRLSMDAAGQQLDVRAGQIVALDAGVRHLVTARSDCTVLITMSID